jgi:hypothetical protein
VVVGGRKKNIVTVFAWVVYVTCFVEMAVEKEEREGESTRKSRMFCTGERIGL